MIFIFTQFFHFFAFLQEQHFHLSHLKLLHLIIRSSLSSSSSYSNSHSYPISSTLLISLKPYLLLSLPPHLTIILSLPSPLQQLCMILKKKKQDFEMKRVGRNQFPRILNFNLALSTTKPPGRC